MVFCPLTVCKRHWSQIKLYIISLYSTENRRELFYSLEVEFMLFACQCHLRVNNLCTLNNLTGKKLTVALYALGEIWSSLHYSYSTGGASRTLVRTSGPSVNVLIQGYSLRYTSNTLFHTYPVWRNSSLTIVFKGTHTRGGSLRNRLWDSWPDSYRQTDRQHRCPLNWQPYFVLRVNPKQRIIVTGLLS